MVGKKQVGISSIAFHLIGFLGTIKVYGGAFCLGVAKDNFLVRFFKKRKVWCAVLIALSVVDRQYIIEACYQSLQRRTIRMLYHRGKKDICDVPTRHYRGDERL